MDRNGPSPRTEYPWLGQTTASAAWQLFASERGERERAANLIDDTGQLDSSRDPSASRCLAETQGIFILCALRALRLALPALLCADIDDPHQIAYLESTLGPMAVVDSRESVTEIAARMRAFSGRLP